MPAQPDSGALGFRKAIERRHTNYMGTPVLLEGGPLAYEPRTAWACPSCKTVLVGTKNGDLYRIAETVTHVEREPLPYGAQSIFGCLNDGCTSYRVALAGDGDGQLHVLRNQDMEPTTSPLKIGSGKVISLRSVRRPGDKMWCFAATDHKELVLQPLHEEDRAEVLQVSRKVWWIRREGNIGSPEGDENRWLLISTDGHLSSARFPWSQGDPKIRSLYVGRLREAPLCVITDRSFDHIRSILYGCESGLRAAMLDKDGVRNEHVLLEGERIHYVRIVHLFGVPYVIAGSENGRIHAKRWEHPEDSRPSGWMPWPTMPSDVLFFNVPDFARSSGDEDAPRELGKTQATLVLRNHRVVGMPLFNIKATLDKLREIRPHTVPASEIPPDGYRWGTKGDDAEGYAEVTSVEGPIDLERTLAIAARGGERTLEGIVRRLNRYPTPNFAQAKKIATAVIIAAMRLGHAKRRELASLLHRQLLVFLRDAGETHPLNEDEPRGPMSERNGREVERDALEEFVVFLKKHFLMARTFSEKRDNLDRFVVANLERPTPDALIYEARLIQQGFDVRWEEELESPVWCMSPAAPLAGTAETGDRNADATACAGLSFGDDTIRELSFAFDQSTQVRFAPAVKELRGPGAPGRLFGHDYSRVLHAAGRAGDDPLWVLASRKATRPPARLLAPSWGDDHWGPEPPQVYSVCELPDGRFLFGLRDLDKPLAVWSPASGEPAQPLDAIWGSSLHTRGTSTVGERRVWSMAVLDDGPSLAIGVEDGYLRTGRIRGRTFEVFKGGTRYLGSAIRVMSFCRSKSPDLSSEKERRFLFCGTQGGEVFCFEVRGEEGAVELVLKFRDLVHHPIVAVFPFEILPAEHVVGVLDDSGRLSVFDLPKKAPGFLGRRYARYRVSDGATAALPLGMGRLLVAGWLPDEQTGRLRLLDFNRIADGHPIPFRSKGRPRGLEQACAVAEKHAPGQALDLLGSFPLDEGGFRRLVTQERLEELLRGDWDQETLESIRDTALTTYPSELREFDGVLETLQRALDKLPDEKAAACLAVVHRVFIEPAGEGFRSRRRESRLQANIVRRLLKARTLRLWRDAGLTEEDLGRWVERNLLHGERLVQIATLRALSEALFHLTRTKPEDTRDFLAVFPEVDGRPPVTSAAWLIDALAQYLFANPSTVYGSECDAATWAAVSVLLNLLRLMPDSAMVLCDHISIRRVNPLVFGVLRRRLGVHDGALRAKLEQYIPWVDHDPSILEVTHHCEPFLGSDADLEPVRERLSIRPGDPDFEFLQAYAACYRCFGAMIAVEDPSQLAELLKTLETIPSPAAPPWAHGLWPERQRFFQFALGWIERIAENLHACMTDEVDEIITRTKARIDTLREELATPYGVYGEAVVPTSLLAPELGTARTILERWKRVLEPSLPVKGSFVWKYRLGDHAPEHAFVFDLEHEVERLARFKVAQSRAEWVALIDTWKTIAEITRDEAFGSCLAPIEHVVDRRICPGIVMARVPGEDLLSAWDELVGDKDRRFEHAFRCAVDISSALVQLHGRQLYHGDVDFSNIVWDRESDTFYLVDYDLSGNQDRWEARGGRSAQTHLPLYTHLISNFSHLSPKDSASGAGRLQECDCAALTQVVIGLLTAKRGDDLKKVSSLVGLKPPTGYEDWKRALRKRFKKPREQVWTADRLLEEAVGEGRGVFVAGVSGETESIRNELFESDLFPWQVQGFSPDTGERIMTQLHRRMRRCDVVIVLLGETSGQTVPLDQIPPYAASWIKGLEAFAWPAGEYPSYTQCEIFMAEHLGRNKQILYFDVSESTAPLNDRRQEAIRRFVLNRSSVVSVRRDRCVEAVREGIRRTREGR